MQQCNGFESATLLWISYLNGPLRWQHLNSTNTGEGDLLQWLELCVPHFSLLSWRNKLLLTTATQHAPVSSTEHSYEQPKKEYFNYFCCKT